jgi:hypothetical protein
MKNLQKKTSIYANKEERVAKAKFLKLLRAAKECGLPVKIQKTTFSPRNGAPAYKLQASFANNKGFWFQWSGAGSCYQNGGAVLVYHAEKHRGKRVRLNKNSPAEEKSTRSVWHVTFYEIPIEILRSCKLTVQQCGNTWKVKKTWWRWAGLVR